MCGMYRNSSAASPASRLHVATTAVVAVFAVLLAPGSGPVPPAATPAGSAAAPAEADVSVVELDLAGVATSELDGLPEALPMPAEEADPGSATGSPQLLLTPAAASTGTAEEQPAPDVLTAPMATAAFSVFGLSWDDRAEGVVVRYRVRTDGDWSPWAAIGESDIGPDNGGADDPGQDGGPARRATDAVVALDADGLQVWAEAEAGSVTGLKAVLIDPGTASSDTLLPAGTPSTAALSGDSTAQVVTAGFDPGRAATALPAEAPYPAPPIITRSQWGADESLTDKCDSDLSVSMQSAAVHHTASTNAYSQSDVPRLLRGFLSFHTRPEAQGGRGWCDIGYNFLVDRFGRVFEGRAGSIEKTVVGAHTGGYNGRTVGVSAIGDYGSTAAPPALLEALSQTIAWKFAQLGIKGKGTVRLVSGGSTSKYPVGTEVTFPTIYGHRDASNTACPGQSLYANLPWIRDRVSGLIDTAVASSPIGSWERSTVAQDSAEIVGWMHDPDTRSPIRLAVEVDGKRTEARADKARPDIAAKVSTAGPAHGFSVDVPLNFGRNVVCLWALNTGSGYDVLLGCRYLTRQQPAVFYLNDSFTGTANKVFEYGVPSDEFFIGDWDGDGRDTPMLRRGNSFSLRNSNSSGPADQTFAYGRVGDEVLVGDWNGDGRDTLAVRRGATFHLKNSVTTGVADTVITYGRPGDIVLVGDWNGDGRDTLAVRRGSVYFVKDSITTGVADREFGYGRPGDQVLVGDWDGNRKDTLAVRRANTYYLRNSVTAGAADVVFTYGRATDTSFAGDWNRDGRDTLGVRRP